MSDHHYQSFVIETFELGANLWNARVRRRNEKPFIADGIALRHLHVGYSWPSSDEALDDARGFVDRVVSRLS